jgi:1-acyl-sn-glycerol-3-phosphate acyltransferase
VKVCVNALRSKLFDVYWAAWTVLFALAIPFLYLCGLKGSQVRRLTRIWVRGTLLGLRATVGLTHQERGRNNIPPEPCLIVANHQSTWETIAFILLFPDVCVVAKQELLSIPVFRWYLRHSPMIIIDRETGAAAIRKMAEQSREALAAGRSVLIFPEGTRRRFEEPVEFRRGVEFLYSMLQVKVLPVALNSGRYWGAGKPYKRAGVITVSYLPPILPGQTGTVFTLTVQALLESEKQTLVEEPL